MLLIDSEFSFFICLSFFATTGFFLPQKPDTEKPKLRVLPLMKDALSIIDLLIGYTNPKFQSD